MKKYIKITVLSISLCVLYVSHVLAQEIIVRNEFASVNPERAIYAAVIAVVIGILGFAWRHRKR